MYKFTGVDKIGACAQVLLWISSGLSTGPAVRLGTSIASLFFDTAFASRVFLLFVFCKKALARFFRGSLFLKGVSRFT